MIKHFGSLYAGHVDLGDLGLGATAVTSADLITTI